MTDRRNAAPDVAAADVVAALLRAIEAGDIDAIRELYAPGATIWHNDDGVAQSVEENVRVLEFVVRRTRSRSYDDVRRYEMPGGVVQQHVLRLAFADGRTAALPAALFVWVDRGRITRIEEYLDASLARAAFAQP